MSWKVTVRHGSDVERERFESLDEAIADARRRVDAVRRVGGLPQASGFREYSPGERVHARIEISGPRRLRGAEAGIDVMGDGALVPYEGAIRKRRLEARGREAALDAIARALGGGAGGG